MVPKRIPSEEKDLMARTQQPVVWCYVSIPIYMRVVGGDFLLFKEPGISLAHMNLSLSEMPRQLYVRRDDKAEAIPEVQACLNKRLSEAIAGGSQEEVKLIMVQALEETFHNPKLGNLEGLGDTVRRMVNGYMGDQDAMRQLALIANNDYTTALHSVNVAALTTAYCFRNEFSVEETMTLGLGALLHDLGKIYIENKILVAPRRLTDNEFYRMRRHPELGYKLLSKTKIPAEAKQPCLQHHERIDGSGYPRGVHNVSKAGQIVGVIDCYEALTSDERFYRKPCSSVEALKILKFETEEGKFSPDIFARLISSLS